MAAMIHGKTVPSVEQTDADVFVFHPSSCHAIRGPASLNARNLLDLSEGRRVVARTVRIDPRGSASSAVFPFFDWFRPAAVLSPSVAAFHRRNRSEVYFSPFTASISV